MILKYFSISDDEETLKKKYRELAFINHPDKNLDDVEGSTARMQDINKEFEYCAKNGGVFKKDIRNGKDSDSLIAELLIIIVEDMLRREKNKTVRGFFQQMKDMFTMKSNF